MDQRTAKPQNANELLRVLVANQGDLGKGGRRLANFIIENPDAAAVLSSSDVAKHCAVHASSVVRLAQGMGFRGFREFQAVLQQHLSVVNDGSQKQHGGINVQTDISKPLNLHLIADSGRSFNEAADAACRQFCALNPSVMIDVQSHVSNTVGPIDFARQIKEVAANSDGIILVAREHPEINDEVRRSIARGVPVICLTTDLPSSDRIAYVGSDQYASGATAGWFCGRLLPQGQAGRVLFICSVPFRCHQDREQGFRHVLRTEFPSLLIDEKVSSEESVDVIYDAVRRYIAKSGPPAAIYNVSGANLGIGRALEDEGLGQKTIFIGHELNANSRFLLERGTMDLTIGHDFEREIGLAVECIKMAHKGEQSGNRITQSLLYSRFNCAIL